MASAATARPKPAQSAQSTRTAPIPELIVKTGFVPMINTFGRVLEFCTAIESQIVWHIYKATVGDAGRSEWLSISAPQLAKAIGCGVDAVNVSLAALLGPPKSGKISQDHWCDLPLLEARGREGVRREYRVLYLNFQKFKRIEGAKPSQTETEEPETDEPETSAAPRSAPHIVRAGARKLLKLEKPVSRIVHINEDHLPLEFTSSADESDGSISFFVRYQPLEKNTGVPEGFSISSPLEKNTRVDPVSAARGKSPGDSAGNPHERRTAHGGQHSQAGRAPAENQFELAHRVRDLREFLGPIVLSHTGENISQDWLRTKLAKKLAGKSLAHYKIQVFAHLEKVRRGKKYLGLGILETLAESTPQSAPAAPPPPEIALVQEPEDSGSVWSRIRLALKPKLKGLEYQNWFVHTAQVRFQGGKLLVCAQDEITVQAIEQEHLDAIRQAIAELGLPVERVEFAAPGKLS